MAQQKVDGVVEAVRYSPDGQVEWVRIYERRGSTFSDRLLLKRQDLIDRIKAKKHYFVGQRLPYLASTFDLNQAVKITGPAGKELLVVGDGVSEHDHLQGVPLL